MKISVISFTRTGMELSQKIAKSVGNENCLLFTKCSALREKEGETEFVKESLCAWCGEQFAKKRALLFIGACGIAVRAIAPHVSDKLSDSPVLVMDEAANYMIPILSGHIGGANELAVFLAKKINAVPVITTATDIYESFAVDLFAKRNGLHIVNREGIAKVSAKVLSAETITMSLEPGHLETGEKLPEEIVLTAYPPDRKVDVLITSEEKAGEAVLLLRPKEYIIGIGCRREKEAEAIEVFIKTYLKKTGIRMDQVAALSSISLKKEEAGIVAFSRSMQIPFCTYTAEELMQVEGKFQHSDFVEQKVFVDNVCERAAMKMAGAGGKLVLEKHAENGMTIAIAKKGWRVSFHEQ